MSLQEFKEGVAYIAYRDQGDGAAAADWSGGDAGGAAADASVGWRPGVARVRIGEAIETAGLGLGDRQAVTDAAREQVAGLIGEE